MPDFDLNLPFRPKWEIEWHHRLRQRCAQRILVVTDNFSSFDPGSATGLTELVRVLQGAGDVPMPMPTSVTTASTRDGFSFATANPAVTTANYDQVWLFGFGIGAAGPSGADLHVLVSFMQAGGGLFATGDHSDIGRPFCGALPRVRAMREWSAVPMGGVDRLDTINHPGSDGVARNSDQADPFPQTIYPLLRGTGAAAAPHPLLASAHGPINVLPDHPHESECYAPRGADLGATYGPVSATGLPTIPAFEEFAPVGGFRVGPELVAISMSASLNVDKGAVDPRCFGAISAYDGHLANVGRVVCDATWHHFVNMNLNGAGYGGDGLREGSPLAANAAYRQVQRYYVNIADYLVPKTRRWCWLFDRVFLELYRYPLWEEIPTLPPLPDPPRPPWPWLVELGSLAAAVFDRRYGAGTAEGMVEALLDTAELPLDLAESISPRRVRFDRVTRRGALTPLADHGGCAELRLGLLGSLIHRIRASLPDDPIAAVDKAESLHDATVKPYREDLLADCRAGLEDLQARRSGAVRKLGALAKSLG